MHCQGTPAPTTKALNGLYLILFPLELHWILKYHVDISLNLTIISVSVNVHVSNGKTGPFGPWLLFLYHN